ncbi:MULTISPECIES: PTS sugar transporter subunit IIB [Lactobacillales]|uniref:PTS sugar transporter subunit IIB n=1 Tax=Lactobacillales TaxID=186826 RepID=UPI00065FCBBB|nr:PTS sugar transporter subunit IIB [Carnobacterium sp. 1290_CSPC]MDV4148985.1 PTS sugar transporter subunit IIB [Enterococcus faecalis]
MVDTTIMLVCTSGMSTSLLDSKMKKVAEDKGIDVEIFAASASDADKNIDVLMLDPQVKYMEKEFAGKLADSLTNLAVINMQDYGKMKGEKVLNEVLTMLGQ